MKKWSLIQQRLHSGVKGVTNIGLIDWFKDHIKKSNSKLTITVPSYKEEKKRTGQRDLKMLQKDSKPMMKELRDIITRHSLSITTSGAGRTIKQIREDIIEALTINSTR